MRIMEEKKKHISLNLAVAVAFMLFAYWILAVKNGFMLRWYDEMSLFEPTRLFLRQFLYYPGGLLRYCGSWLTQLMYHPWLGVTVLIALWLLLAWLTHKAFGLQKALAPLALLVPLAMLVSVGQLDEAWLTIKSPGYVYSNTLGYIFTVAIAGAYRAASRQTALAGAIAVISPLCYFIAGFYALLGAGLCVVMAVKEAIADRKYINIAAAVGAAAMIAVVPPAYYRYFQGNTVDNDYLYLKGLPELMMEAFDKYLWVPFIVATAVLLFLAAANGTRLLKDNTFYKWLSVAAVCACAVWGAKASEKSEHLRATVLMLQHIDQNDWAGTAGVMSRIKEPPNYTMRLLNNLALVNLGGEWQSMKGYTPARGDGRHSEKFTMTAFVNVPLCYNIGRLSESYRWAMEHTVQYGKRVFFLKYMVKAALLRGETQLAKKYNDILLSTMFHRKWAEEMERYIENPKLIESDTVMQKILEQGENERKGGNNESVAQAQQ